ncbi:MAG: diguanylate cyclase [Acidobacteriota bacterium]|nr:diguanylate cyclase [Acidobacteriota bacterium]
MAVKKPSPRERGVHLEILNEIVRIATLDLELRPMLQRITDALAQKFGWEFVACVTVDRDRKHFTCEAVTTTQPTEIDVGYGRELGSGVVGEVATLARPILLDDVRTAKNYVETMPGTRSELCVPVLHRGELVAILNLESTRLREFHDQLPLVQTIADQIAGAIHSARLFQQAQQANRALADANRRLEELSRTDGLTGVANRRQFEDVYEREWRRATRVSGPIALLMIDIDEFKKYNDRYGHQGGDDCLKRVAETLKQTLGRASDVVARYGGEEFVVVLPGSDQQAAIATAERLRQQVEKLGLPHEAATSGNRVVTISVGVAFYQPTEKDRPETLLSAADQALYGAKHGGRNRTCAAVFSAVPR